MFTRLRKSTTIISLMIAGAFVLSACAPAATPQPTPSATTAPPPAVTPSTGGTTDWTTLGFSKVLGSQDITPGTATTIKADPYSIAVPADAFTAPVKFEVLAADVSALKAQTPTGETPDLAFAFDVTDAKTGQPIVKFNKPVSLTVTSPSIVAGSMYYNLAPDGTYTANPTGLEVKAGELMHPVGGSSVAWVIMVPASPTSPVATPSSSSGSTPTSKNPDTIVEATYGDPSSLDPAWAYDTASGEVIFNVYETLVFPKKDSTTEFVPMLATKWDVSSDGKTYTFTIRKGVKFQDGQDLTPEDVAYSFWRGMIQDRSGGPQ